MVASDPPPDLHPPVFVVGRPVDGGEEPVSLKFDALLLGPPVQSGQGVHKAGGVLTTVKASGEGLRKMKYDMDTE